MEHLPPYFSGSSFSTKEHRLARKGAAGEISRQAVPVVEASKDKLQGPKTGADERIQPNEAPNPGAARVAGGRQAETGQQTEAEKNRVAKAAALNVEPTSHDAAL